MLQDPEKRWCIMHSSHVKQHLLEQGPGLAKITVITKQLLDIKQSAYP